MYVRCWSAVQQIITTLCTYVRIYICITCIHVHDIRIYMYVYVYTFPELRIAKNHSAVCMRLVCV